MKKLFYLSLFSVMLLNCGGDDSDNSDDEINLDDPEQVAQLLNENLNVSGNSFIVNPDDVIIDPTISVSSASAGRMPIRTGIDLINTIGFTPSSNRTSDPITAVGMRFGPNGPIRFVEVSEDDIANGIASFVFSIDPEICQDISQICHDIKCYEFAQTSSGSISQADLQDIALVCGACDEPSCLSLLDEDICNGNGLQGAEGFPRFNLTWSGSADLDLYVTDPLGETLSYDNPFSNSGGMLDIDCLGDCFGGNVENIFWENQGPSGTYTFFVNYFSGSQVTPFTVSVNEGGNVISTVSGSLSIDGENSTTWSYNKN